MSLSFSSSFEVVVHQVFCFLYDIYSEFFISSAFFCLYAYTGLYNIYAAFIRIKKNHFLAKHYYSGRLYHSSGVCAQDSKLTD